MRIGSLVRSYHLYGFQKNQPSIVKKVKTTKNQLMHEAKFEEEALHAMEGN